MRLLSGILILAFFIAPKAQTDEFGTSANVNILDPKVLGALESNGFSLAQMLRGAKNESRTSELFKTSSAYRDFANFFGQSVIHDKKTDQLPSFIPPNHGEVPEMVRLIRNFEDKGKRSSKDLMGGYLITQLANNSQYPYTIEYDGDEPRHFDYRWLKSPFGYFKLVGVVNRMDRADFDQSSCGEVRFIYRLSYRSPKSSSSMPFFLNRIIERNLAALAAS